MLRRQLGRAGAVLIGRGRSRERHCVVEAPRVFGPVDPDILGPRFDAERVQQPVIVVRIAVEFVDGNIELIRPFHEVEALDREHGLGVAKDALGSQLFDVSVGTIAAHAFGVENPDTDDEVLDGHRRAQLQAHVDWFAAVEDVRGYAVAAGQADVDNLDLARAPATLGRAEHVGGTAGALDRVVGQHR